MESLTCFYIRFRGKTAKPMALEVKQVDKYAPRKTGVYDVDIQEMRTKKSDKSKNKLAQQWLYDAKTRALTSRLYANKVMFEGFNKNLIIYKYNQKLKNQKFAYDVENHMWFNELTKRALLPANEVSPGSTIATDNMSSENESMKWDIIRCEDAEEDDEKKEEPEKKEEEKEEEEEEEEAGKEKEEPEEKEEEGDEDDDDEDEEEAEK